jgi:dihydroflavonol-4-reductase
MAVRYAVTGAAGRLGNVLVRQLCALSNDVRVLVRPGHSTQSLAGLPVRQVFGDVRDERALLPAFEGADVVFHLASLIDIGSQPARTIESVNVDGTRAVLAACRKARVGRLVHTSSVHAFPEPEGDGILDERAGFDPDRTIGEYGRTKAIASRLVVEASRRDLDAVVVCPTGIVGPMDYGPSEMGCTLLGFARQAVVPIVLDGGYDFVDVRDVARALLQAAERGTRGEAYLVSGGRMSMQELARTVTEGMGRRRPTVVIPLPVAAALARVAPVYYRVTGAKPTLTSYAVHVIGAKFRISDDKARRELGYDSMPLDQSIRDQIAWFCERGLLKAPAAGALIRSASRSPS